MEGSCRRRVRRERQAGDDAGLARSCEASGVLEQPALVYGRLPRWRRGLGLSLGATGTRSARVVGALTGGHLIARRSVAVLRGNEET